MSAHEATTQRSQITQPANNQSADNRQEALRQQILQAFRFRHACKTFDPARKISSEDFATIIEAGRLSPSSFGFEPWQFLLIQNPQLREQLSENSWGGKRQFASASHVLIGMVRRAPGVRHDSDYIRHMMTEVQQLPAEVVNAKGGFFRTFQEQDFNLLESERSLTDWATHQTYLPLANMMTVAALLGIDSCPIEGFVQEVWEQQLQELTGVDNTMFKPVWALALGYRLTEPGEKPRRPLGDVLHRFD